jgi:hypothetical protein
MIHLRNHTLLYLSLGLIVIAITLTQFTAFYYSQRLIANAPSSGCPAFVCTLINFGNSTTRWYNETNVTSKWNFYNLTVFLAHGDVQAEYYPPPLNEHLIVSIDGVKNSGQFSWTLWMFCGTRNAWVFSAVGADAITLTSGRILAWAYEISDSQSPPVPGSATVSSCP